MSVAYEKKLPGKTQEDGNETIDNETVSGMTNATTHQVSIDPETATEGTIAVMKKAYGKSEFTALLDEYGAAVVIDIAAPKDYIFDGNIDALRFDPTDVDGTYGIAVSGWA